MNKSKLSLLIMSLGMVTALCACGGPAESSSDSSAAPSSSQSNPDSSATPSSTPASSESAPSSDPSSQESAPASSDDGSKGSKGSEGSKSDSEPPAPQGKTGISSLIGADAAERTDILGTLEKYAVDNMITGMPLFENGGYVMYNPRVVKGTETYISGYGFGILREGHLTGSLTNPEVVKPEYYNSADTSDPGKINALDNNGSQVSNLYANIASSYFGTKMNAAKNGYDWYGVLSTKDRPYIVKDGVAKYPDDPEETSRTWRVYVRTGETGGVKFHTLSKLEDRKTFDGRYVTLDDYLNAFKVLLCKKFNYYRGNELQKQSGYSAIAGAGDYWKATNNGIDEEAFKNLGVKGGHDDVDGDYLEFTLGAPANRFYAMYGLASDLYAPINLDFFNLVTDNGANPKNYGGYSSDKSTSPVDNILSTGVYSLESWETDIGIAFKRNDDWWERVKDPQLYSVPGQYVNIFTAGKQDPNFIFEQYLAGRIDAASIPLAYVDEYKNHQDTTTTKGTSVFKLNVNSCSQDTWNSLFGSKGSVAQLGDNAYECKPWMSNENFIKGLFFSIDRTEFGAKRGRVSSTNYFASNYLSDPENGISYNSTTQHANALEDFWGDTLATGGYSEALSKAAFNDAIEELLASGDIKDNDKLVIDSWWMEQSDIEDYANDIDEYIEKSFNNATAAKEHGLTLDAQSHACEVWSDVYDKHLQVGKFDLGFGSISGNSLDPLNFMEVLKSDNSSGFTLNWGKDTSALDLEYKGDTWSFNTLWAAVDHGVVTKQGVEARSGEVADVSAEYNEEEGLIVEYKFRDGKAILKELNDVDSNTLLQIPEDEWSLDIKDTYLSFNAGYGRVDMEPDGTVDDTYFMDADSNPVWYQALYDFDDEGNPIYYNMAEDGADPASTFGDSWTDVIVNEDEETGFVEFKVIVKGGAGRALAETGFVSVILEVNQSINGVDSCPATTSTVPIKNAPTKA